MRVWAGERVLVSILNSQNLYTNVDADTHARAARSHQMKATGKPLRPNAIQYQCDV